MTRPLPARQPRAAARGPASDAPAQRSWPARARSARARAARHRRAIGLVGAGIATGMAVLWTVVVPGRADEVSGVQELAIRWGHPATWAMLAGLGVLVAVDAPKPLRSAAGWTSLACYGAFVLALAL